MPLADALSRRRVAVGCEGIPTWLGRSLGTDPPIDWLFLACMKPKLTNVPTMPDQELPHSTCCARVGPRLNSRSGFSAFEPQLNN